MKVASYCRVSTDRDDQANSFESQQRYFREYIDRRPDWELYATYADEGITGTSTKKRVQFNRMIEDARMGRFQLIITKEVSRFSRNILDTISFTRELKSLGVGVIFMNDGISTFDPDAELRLSIMGSIAQEESRKTSSRVRWGQTRQMERGVVFGKSMLGYDVKDGRMSVNPEGAEIVRLIFHKYGMEKKGTSTIARELREAGYRTFSGNPKWSNSHILKILNNEKYVGDLVQKKTITTDYLTHNKKYNHGEEELVVIRDHHEPIIDRELWEAVQAELHKRDYHSGTGDVHSNRYVFSGKIKCGECGASFVSRQRRNRDGTVVKRWSCGTATNEGKKHVDAQGNEVGCDVGKIIRDDLAMDMLKQTIASLEIDPSILDNLTKIAADAILGSGGHTAESLEKLEQEIRKLTRKKEKVMDAFFDEDISKEDMLLMNRRYDSQLDTLQARLAEAKASAETIADQGELKQQLREQIGEIVACKTDSDIFYRTLLDKMTVYQGGRVEVQLNHLPQKWVFQLENAGACPTCIPVL